MCTDKPISVLSAIQTGKLFSMVHTIGINQLLVYQVYAITQTALCCKIFKLMHSIDNVDYSYLFEINYTTTRGHRLKLKKQFCKTNCRKFSFSQRVINDWNSLPQTLVQTRNLNSFKSGIDCFFDKIIYDI